MKGIFAAAAATKKPSGGDSKELSVESSEFKFNFSMNNEGEGTMKKNKKRKKKKSKSKTNKGENGEGVEDEDSNDEEEQVSGTVKAEISVSATATQEEVVMNDLEQLTKQISSILIEAESSIDTKPSNNTNTTSTGANPAAADANGDKKKKKKNNKNKKKSGSTTATSTTDIDSDDEFLDALIKTQQEEAAKAAATSKQAKKAAPTPSVPNKSPLKQPPGLSIVSKPSGPRFMSPNDPELDPKTKMIAKYGQGKNLVAIGPKKVRDPSWIAPSTPANPIDTTTLPVENAASALGTGSTVQYHQSPFSFSFGGL
jgi:hypothetical protein